VLNGYFQAARQPVPGAVLGYLPSGTGSDFARTMGLYGLPLALQVEKLASGTVRLLDCGQVHFHGAGPSGAPLETSRLFLNESSLGFSAETVHQREPGLQSASEARCPFSWGCCAPWPGCATRCCR
jgi:diacylglycerol kinase family enzyme